MNAPAPLVVVGDALLDRDVIGRVERLCPDAPAPVLEETTVEERPGGAGLAALIAAVEGHDVVLVTPLAADAAGLRLRQLLEDAGVTVWPLPDQGRTEEKIRLLAHGQVMLRWDRGERSARVDTVPAEALAAVEAAGAVLVSDYGRGTTGLAALRRVMERAARQVPVVWDPHPRGHTPVPGIRLATPNAAEARRLAGLEHPGEAAAAVALCRLWRCPAIAVTLGADGALLVVPEQAPFPVRLPAPRVAAGNPCGAGDRFAVAALEGLRAGATLTDAIHTAVVKATSFVAIGGARRLSAPAPSPTAPPDCAYPFVWPRRVSA